MRISVQSKNNISIITLFILLFVVPFLTSFMLDLKLVQQQFARVLLVYMLLLFQVVILLFLLISKLKK